MLFKLKHMLPTAGPELWAVIALATLIATVLFIALWKRSRKGGLMVAALLAGYILYHTVTWQEIKRYVIYQSDHPLGTMSPD